MLGKTPFLDVNFQVAIEFLPPWEKHLFSEIVFIQNKEAVWKAICNNQCYATSDGSAPKEQGSFAWINSYNLGDCLARCSGPVFGYAISSFRAESYRLISILRFLLHVSHWHKKLDKQLHSLHIVRDSQGLIKTIAKLQVYPHIFPNATMDAEWDCLAQIWSTICDLDVFSPTLKHVKGHQDEQTP